jgi:pimeloyl-ACP methyl ester carboxylesterase
VTRLALTIACRCTLAAVLGLVCQACEAQTTQNKVDLGGYKVFTSESGVGTPVVVFESGLGEDTATWQKVEPQVSKLTRTFAYDRAGLGKSDPSPNPKSVVLELHLLLRAGKVPSPYILVGHSLGGALVQLFAYSYPSEVAGIVLVDPEDGRLLDRLQSRMTPSQWNERQKAFDQAMPKFSDAQKAELEGCKASAKTLSGAVPLPNVPVVLLTGTKKDPDFPGNPLEQDLKLELHDELLSKLPHGKHVLVPESRHYIQDDAPNVVMEAIRAVLNESRKGGLQTEGQ